MENRVADHYVGKVARKRHFFDGAHLEIVGRQPGSKRCSELTNVINPRGIRVHCKYFAAFAKQVHQVSAVAASGVEHAHSLRDISAQDLIEDVNIDLAELVLNCQRNAFTFRYSTVTDLARLRGWSTSQSRRSAM